MQYFEPHIHTDTSPYGIFKVLASDLSVVITSDLQELPVKTTNRALHLDIVYYSSNDDGTVDIIDIKERVKHRLPAVIILTKTKIIGTNNRGLPIYECVPVDWRYPEFYVASNVKKSFGIEGVTNQYVLIEFHEWTEKQKFPLAYQNDVIGSVGDIDAEQRVLLLKNNIYSKTYPKGLPEIKPIDLSDRETFQKVIAIDPEGSLDYDDAFHIVIDPDSSTLVEIGVHISDVTAYFHADSPYEDEIRKRLTSLYLITKRYNMIPDKYAHDMCSLVAGKERATISVIFKIEDNMIVSHRFCLSRVTVSTNLTYEHANKILQKRNHNTQLIYLANLFNSKDSHIIVEKLMVLANHAVGTAITNAGYGLLRVHSSVTKPGRDSDSILVKYLTVRSSSSSSAKYKFNPTDKIHSGLGLECYTHFTSPIRRYPDILVHRILKFCCMKDSELELEKDYPNICDNINGYYSQVSKLYRDQDILKLYHKINTEHKGICVSTCYPIEYSDGVLTIFLPEYNLEYRYRPVSIKLKDAMHCKVEDNILTLTVPDLPIITIELYKLYSVELITDNITHRIKHKIRVKIGRMHASE